MNRQKDVCLLEYVYTFPPPPQLLEMYVSITLEIAEIQITLIHEEEFLPMSYAGGSA